MPVNYVYIYLDPRKSGQYRYGEYKFNYEPFYVGKGRGRRFKSLDNRNKYFKNKISNIKKLELEPIIIKIEENLNEQQSLIKNGKRWKYLIILKEDL